MAHFRHNPASIQKGTVEYNDNIVNSIVAIAIGEVEGVSLPSVKNKGIKLKFDNQAVCADICVRIDYGYDVPSLAFRIQQAIKHNVESMTKYKVDRVDVHITDVRFTDSIAI